MISVRPLTSLGGGQLTLDVRHGKYPLALSVSGEYYMNSAEPTHHYEISGLTAINLLYVPWTLKNTILKIFFTKNTVQLNPFTHILLVHLLFKKY